MRKRRQFTVREDTSHYGIKECRGGTFKMWAYTVNSFGRSASWSAAGIPTWDEAVECLRAAWAECPL